MQNLTTSASSNGAILNFLQAATEPIGHVDGTIPIRSDYSQPHPSSQQAPNKRRNNSRRSDAEIPAEPKDDDHVIDDYA